MSFLKQSLQDELTSEINMTPFVDIMLVLLIIFIVTIPAVQQTIVLDLPKVEAQTVIQKTETIEVAVKENGDFYLNGEMISDEALALEFKMFEITSSDTDHAPTIAMHILGDQNAKYARIAKVMSIAQLNGLNKIGFIVEHKD